MIPILYWRICHEVVQAGFDPTSLLFACAIHCASRVFRSYGPIQRTITDSARAIFPSRAAATRRADRLVPRRPRCAGSRGVNVSKRDCRADRWMQSHSNLKGEELAKEVDKQPWDPSVKALTQFPSVLENMDKNLSWTSSLGDAYANQQEAVTDAVQAMRQQARKAGHLNSNEQEKVTAQGNTIIIEPANPEVVYVPAYDPWLVYGEPIVAYPGWYPVPGIFLAGAGIGFGIGFGLGFFGGYGWGWHHWGYDWHGRTAIYNHNTYISHSRTIINRNNFNHGNFNHGNAFHGSRPGGGGPGFHGSSAPHFQPGTRSGAFSGFDHGGNVRGFSSRGRSSFGGGSRGGGFHGGGGGRHR